MADKKISELTELETPQSTDLLPIVDMAETPITKKVEVSNLVTKTLVGLGNVTNDTQLKAADLDTDTTLAANSDTKIPSQKAVKTYADTKSLKHILINTQTDNYTLVLSDDGKLIDMNKSEAVTLTIPKNSAVAFPIGTVIVIRQLGTGVVTIAPVDTDVTIVNPSGLITTGRYAIAGIIKVAENTWTATGSLEE